MPYMINRIWGLKQYIKKRLLLRCIHHFKSDLINNMDHMHISGTEPSSMILSQKRNFQKLKRDVPNVPKQAEAKRDGVINPPKIQFQTILTRKILVLSNATNQEKLTVELGYMCPPGTRRSTNSDTHQVVEI